MPLTADFGAGVWMDALQEAIMVFGVGVIFFLMPHQTKGLEKATRSVANMISSNMEMCRSAWKPPATGTRL